MQKILFVGGLVTNEETRLGFDKKLLTYFCTSKPAFKVKDVRILFYDYRNSENPITDAPGFIVDNRNAGVSLKEENNLSIQGIKTMDKNQLLTLLESKEINYILTNNNETYRTLHELIGEDSYYEARLLRVIPVWTILEAKRKKSAAASK